MVHIKLDDVRTLCGREINRWTGYSWEKLEAVSPHEPDRNPDGHDWCTTCIRTWARSEWVDGYLFRRNIQPLPKMWKRRGY